MKFQKIVRLNAIVIGISSALFFTASVRSQEIENTEWNDSSTVAANSQPAPAPPANKSNSSSPDSLAMSPDVPASESTAKQEAAIAQWAPVQFWLLASLLACIAIVAVYSLAEARRTNRHIAARMRAINPRSNPL